MYIIRQATTMDLPAVLEISRTTFYNSYVHLNDPADFEMYMKQTFTLAKVKQELLNPKSQFWLAERKEELLAYLKINFDTAQSDLHVSDGLEVERIYVSQKHQRQGIGKSLMEKAISIANGSGMKYIWLGVWDRNPGAIKFYEQRGFHQFGTHIFQVGSDQQIDVLMRLDL